jgi:hypothetical protein
MQINLNQSNVNPSDLVAWVHKGYMYCPVLTVGDQIFSHEIVDMSDPDKEPFFYEGSLQKFMDRDTFIDFVDYMIRATKSGL